MRHWVLRHEGARPLTVNAVAGMHRQHWAKHTKAVRYVFWVLALEQKIPRLERVKIVVVPLHRNGTSPQDPAACAPEAKAAVDGMVDAKVLPDDSARYVSSVEFFGPYICGVDGMELRIYELREDGGDG